MAVLNVDNSGGIFMGCLPSGNSIVMAPQPLVTQFVGDDTVWTTYGPDPWVANGDYVTLTNPGGNVDYVVACAPLSPSQSGTTNPITFRFSCYGDIEPPPGTAWNAQLFVTGSGGMNQVWRSGIMPLPVGEFGQQQISVTVTPPGYEPSYYAYAYIYGTNQSGTLTVWDAEIFQVGDPPRRYAYWKSEPIDIFSLDQQSINETNNTVRPISFALSDISNIDDSYSVQHSLNVLSRSAIVVTQPPNIFNNPRQQYVINQLMNLGVQIFGYVDVGNLGSGSYQEITTLINYCASGSYKGVFLDHFGYDYNNTREFQNTVLDYVHGQNLLAMPTATYFADVLMNNVDPIYNPSGTLIHLQPNDWYLIDNFYQTASGTYDIIGKGFVCTVAGYVVTTNIADGMGVKVAGRAFAFPDQPYMDMTEITNAYLIAVGSGLQGLCYTTTCCNEASQYTLPPVNVGNQVIDKLHVVSIIPERMEAQTDQGIIWAEGADPPVVPTSYRETGVYAIERYVDVTLGSMPNFEATLVQTGWEYSPDKVNWYPLPSGSVQRLGVGQRYLRAFAYMYN